MAKTTYTIGRDSGNDIKVMDTSVSSFHAQITLLNDTLFEIEDLSSTNGTFVNGHRVRKAKATYSDTVKVAAVVVKVRKLIKDFEINLKGNCAAEFNALKKVHDDYKAAKSSLAQNQNISQVLRISSPTIVGVGVNIATGTHQTWATILGVGLSLLMAYLGGNKFADRMNRLDEEFTEAYRCPKCGHSLKGQRWEKWKDEKVCPSCKILWVEE
jgi:hypothetical protein